MFLFQEAWKGAARRVSPRLEAWRCRFPHADARPNVSHAISCLAAPRSAVFTSEKCTFGRGNLLGIRGNAYLESSPGA